ncbi:MAG: xanthine dehydrogenase family protein subunit M [Burkholderiales bacterium]|jgi:aerobic carbon-monoxide dehydrogenase medium subunit|nr:xanthine dehydrogenase family protein subunit M [Burkholderiales bacterium]
MKAPPFRYHAPRTLDEALSMAATLPSPRLLAGGQSLMPMLNFRLLAPENLIDLNRVEGLSGIRESGDAVVIGAMTRQREIEFSALVKARLPLLAEAIQWVGHRQTRNRGTIGGSLCHLDPSAEQPMVAMAMEATLSIAGPGGRRDLPMRAFALDLMTPALEDGEILAEVRFTPWAASHGWAFLEFARRHGDYAIVAVAVLIELGADGTASRVSITLGGVAATAVRVADAEAALLGTIVSPSDIDAAAACCGSVDALGDPQVPGWYRQRLARTLCARAIPIALARAAGGPASVRHPGNDGTNR